MYHFLITILVFFVPAFNLILFFVFQAYYQQIEKKFTKGLCEVIVFDKINDSTTVHEIVSELIRGKHVKNTMQNSSLENDSAPCF